MRLGTSIRAKLLAAMLLLGFIPLSAGAGSLILGWRVLTRVTQEFVGRVPVAASTRIEELLYFRYVDIAHWARLDVVADPAAREAQSRLFAEIVSLYRPYAWVGLVDPSGRVVSASDPASAGADLSEAPWFRTARAEFAGVPAGNPAGGAGGATSWGELPVSVSDVHPLEPGDGQPVVGFTTPVRDRAGRLQGYLHSEVWLSFVVRHVLSLQPTPGARALLLDRAGRVLADNHGPRPVGDASPALPGWGVGVEDLLRLRAVQAALRGDTGVLRERVGQQDALVGFVPMRGYGPYRGLGWSLLLFLPVSEAYAAIWDQARFTAAILLVGLLLVIAVAVVLSRQMSAPVLRLAGIARRAEAGELVCDFPASGTRDEIAELTESFRGMVRAIGRKQSELEEANRRLEEANRQLEEANRLQSEFLTNVTHESRTPLTAVLAATEMLRQEVVGPLGPRQLRYVESIEANARRALEWINNLLDLARAEAGRMEFRPMAVDVPEVARRAREALEGPMGQKGLACREEWEPDLPAVRADPERLQQVLLNLLGNAVKFTPEGGSIAMGARRDGPAAVSIYVRDTGIGIPPEEQERIFEKFHQVDTRLSRRYPGTGVGLALVRRLVELHGGTIRVWSRPGEGAEFTVTLPVAAPERVPAAGGDHDVGAADPRRG
ncbi:HAMP domain-containing sensor histidine kinase [Caldinitratiruptor microaerophilus]|uniref:histidine kinase n=1 Tax=Caldinitratiruptor microaerophilus TaxID=671077 RepID=A0AA35CMD4_9FIRM|nr:ATP-binding protein [Caldinitratiruptor microaerophilus]BDG61995.1 hypothetical protein caldi_30850 [Caldinitratiruptor microaerophilus]